MKKSNKLFSLGGWAGILVGLYAIAGSILAYIYQINSDTEFYEPTMVVYLFVGVFVLSFITSFIFAYIKAKDEKESVFNKLNISILEHLGVCLLMGAILFIKDGDLSHFPFITLCFYGLGLLSASKYGTVELKYMAYANLVLSILSMLYVQFGILFWGVGFGLGHIYYGVSMWYRREQ